MRKYLFMMLMLNLYLAIFACKEENKNENLVQTTTTVAESKGMNLVHLLGTWVNKEQPEQQFALYNDGTIGQKNMDNLKLKDWTLEGEKLIFARKNSSGQMTEMNREEYIISELTAEKLILSTDGTWITFYKK